MVVDDDDEFGGDRQQQCWKFEGEKKKLGEQQAIK